ncbi:MAG: hypothetical protein EA425_18285 [Puniceicoccaceae bacterium]|nr:MAG: hypothetical protein EA425_18285 [Puniceicoccaceae bacterium]
MRLKGNARIFNIGLPRTGTTSFALTLDRLGLPCLHFPFDLYKDINSRCLDDYQAFSDTPLSLLYPELDKIRPGSLFILTKREKPAWLNSMHWLRTVGPRIWARKPIYDEYNLEFFGTKGYDEAVYSAVYDRFHSEAEDYFKDRRDDLLIIDITRSKDTTQLNQFLDLDVPAVPWVRSNESRTPTILQNTAFHLEQRSLRRAGAVLRKIDRRIQRVLRKK